MPSVELRQASTSNDQVLSDFFSGFPARITSPNVAISGAVAQLGERRDGIAKVWGSIPHGSTTPPLSV